MSSTCSNLGNVTLVVHVVDLVVVSSLTVVDSYCIVNSEECSLKSPLHIPYLVVPILVVCWVVVLGR